MRVIYIICSVVFVFSLRLNAQISVTPFETEILVQDSLAFFGDLAIVDDWLFAQLEGQEFGIRAYNAKTGVFEYEFGKRGRGPAEYGSVTIQKGIFKHSLEVADASNDKNDVYDVNCLKKKPPISKVHNCIIESEKTISRRHALILRNNQIVNHGPTPEGLLSLSDGGEFIRYLDTIPSDVANKYKKPNRVTMSMSGRLAKIPDGSRFAYFANTFDRALFYGIVGDSVVQLHEQKHTFLPEFDVIDYGASSVMMRSIKFKGGFYSPTASSKRYFVLYSGRTAEDVELQEDTDWRGFSNRIIAYDWDGIEQGDFYIDKDVFIIDISEDEKELYAIHVNSKSEQFIIKATLN